MTAIVFSKPEDKEKYFCSLYTGSYYFNSKMSTENYQEAGKQILEYLRTSLDNSVESSFKLIRHPSSETPKKEELKSIKNSLDKFIQDNKLNIKLIISEGRFRKAN